MFGLGLGNETAGTLFWALLGPVLWKQQSSSENTDELGIHQGFAHTEFCGLGPVTLPYRALFPCLPSRGDKAPHAGLDG